MAMNLRLYLMRHAEAESAGSSSDLMRKLTSKGIEQAKQAAEFLKDYHVDKLVVSYAKRTMQTSKYISDTMEDVEVEIVEELYNSDEDRVIDLLKGEGDQYKHMLVVGHNPVIYNVAMELADRECKRYKLLEQSSMPPARIIVLDFKRIINWSYLEEEKADIVDIFTPN